VRVVDAGQTQAIGGVAVERLRAAPVRGALLHWADAAPVDAEGALVALRVPQALHAEAEIDVTEPGRAGGGGGAGLRVRADARDAAALAKAVLRDDTLDALLGERVADAGRTARELAWAVLRPVPRAGQLRAGAVLALAAVNRLAAARRAGAAGGDKSQGQEQGEEGDERAHFVPAAKKPRTLPEPSARCTRPVTEGASAIWSSCRWPARVEGSRLTAEHAEGTPRLLTFISNATQVTVGHQHVLVVKDSITRLVNGLPDDLR